MKYAIVIVLLILSLNSIGQGYGITKNTTDAFAGVAFGNKGLGFNIGFLSNQSVTMSLGYNVPFKKAENPVIFYMNIGKQFNLTNNDDNNFNLTTSIGIAHTSRMVFDKNVDGTKVTEVLPIYTLEAGKDFFTGRVFVSFNYCGTTFYNIGMKAFLR